MRRLGLELDMAAQAVDQLVAQMVEVDGAVGDLAQRDDRVLVVVAIDVSGAPAEMSRARWAASMTSSNRLGHALDAVFDGDACHDGDTPIS